MVGSPVYRRGLAAASAVFALTCLAQPASAETRNYVVSWLTHATNSVDGDCPGGINPDIEVSYLKLMAEFGKSPKEAAVLVNAILVGGSTVDPAKRDEARELIEYRGRIDGKPVNAYTNPASVKDPMMKSITGKYAFGFNLDGKGAATSNGFEDPETHEKGVNNQAYRALGCFASLRGTLKNRATQWAWTWDQMRNNMPAWLLTIEGADLNKDGEATIIFDRALEHVTRDANGDVQADMTYRIDSDPRSHHVFAARIKDGVLTLVKQENLRIVADPMIFPELSLAKAQLRLKLLPDDTLDGFVGGYQPWKAIYFAFGQGNQVEEMNLNFDLAGIYHLLRRLADAEPDPVTGKNQSISTTYRLEAVRAFAVKEGASTAAASFNPIR